MSAMDRGLAYGDGIFRTFLSRDGAPRHWRRHYSKLASDCGRLGLMCPPEAVLSTEVASACRAESQCVVKLIVTRGRGERGYQSAGVTPTRIVLTAPMPEHPIDNWQSGVRVRTCTLKLARQPALAGIKHLNRLESVLARAEWDDPSIAEGILCDAGDHAIGGTMTNLFIATKEGLATPEVTHCGVAGVTRDRVMSAARRDGIHCEVRAVTMEEVRRAREVFLVNSVIGLWPVRAVDADQVSVGPIAMRLQRCLDAEDDAKVD